MVTGSTAGDILLGLGITFGTIFIPILAYCIPRWKIEKEKDMKLFDRGMFGLDYSSASLVFIGGKRNKGSYNPYLSMNTLFHVRWNDSGSSEKVIYPVCTYTQRNDKRWANFPTGNPTTYDIFSYMVFFWNWYPEMRTFFYAYIDRLAFFGANWGDKMFEPPQKFNDFKSSWDMFINDNPFEKRKDFDRKYERELAVSYLLYLEDLRGRIAKDSYTVKELRDLYVWCYRLLDFLLTEIEYKMLKDYIDANLNDPYTFLSEEQKTNWLVRKFGLNYKDLLNKIYNHESRLRYAEVIDGKVTEVDKNGEPVSQELKDYYAKFEDYYFMLPYEPLYKRDRYDFDLPYIHIKKSNELFDRKDEKELLRNEFSTVQAGLSDWDDILDCHLAPADLKFEH